MSRVSWGSICNKRKCPKYSKYSVLTISTSELQIEMILVLLANGVVNVGLPIRLAEQLLMESY